VRLPTCGWGAGPFRHVPERDTGQMTDRRIDLNADVGEEMGDDAALLRVVTSANVACGLHAGSVEVMKRVCAWAVEQSVVIGAHVSYDDREGFGRRHRDVAPEVLRQQVADQVGILQEAAAAAGTTVAYLKPHGALYHRVAVDEEQATAVLAGSGELPVLGLRGALILELAAAIGRRTGHEGFPDRGHTPDGRMLAREEPGAVLTDSTAVSSQAIELAARVDSLCLHGDSPGALEHAHAVRRRLEERGWTVARHF